MKIGVVFGGASVEHEVSIISGLQVAEALQASHHDVVAIYVAKDGTWFVGDGLLSVETYKRSKGTPKGAIQVDPIAHEGGRLELRRRKRSLFGAAGQTTVVDLVFLAVHGGAGENGSLQGLCQTFGVPYTGSGVMGSAVGMDKITAKALCHSAGIQVVPYERLSEHDWRGKEDAMLTHLESVLGAALVVKPSSLGSSIGISITHTRDELEGAIENALRYDQHVLVEKAISPLREINCSVLGTSVEARASVLEEPVATAEGSVLTFQDKYERGGGSTKGSKAGPAGAGMASLDRIIPAPIPDALTAEIQSLAVSIFQLLKCSGLARIDFIYEESKGIVYFNEINTIPGSFSYYLWEPSGLPFTELVSEMVSLAQAEHTARASRVTSYDTNILSLTTFGTKGSKG